MQRLLKQMAVTGALAFLCVATQTVAQDQPQPPGQGRGNFDPEQFRQRQMERYRETLEVKGDDEWKIISARIEKVTEARREVGFGGMGRGMMGGPRGQRGGDNAPPAAPQGDAQQNAGRRAFGGGTPSPEAEALQKAIDAKASADEIKTKLTALRQARKEKQASLEKAQEELRKVLSARQEAIAVVNNILN